jgi:ribonuclease HII
MLLNRYTEFDLECGVDESGAGTAFGPVVAAAVIMPADWSHPLLNDSKKVTEKRRILLAEEIKSNAICFSIAEVSAERIDEINILQARFEAMNKAISNLNPKPEHLSIDGNRFVNKTDIPFTCIVKGDSKYISIAAASILAKVYRDNMMIDMSNDFKEWNISKHKGYLTKEHIESIKRHGASTEHRKTFLKNFL